MLKQIIRKVAIAATVVALVTPAAHATPTGTDPEPGAIHTILAFFGLA